MNHFASNHWASDHWASEHFRGLGVAVEEIERNRLITSTSIPSPVEFQIFYEPGAKKLKKVEYTRSYKVIENRTLRAKLESIEEEARYKARKRRNKAIALLLLER